MTHRRLDVALVVLDLTGALDAAAPFAGRGLETRILLDFEQAAAAVETNTRVLSLTSESRHLSPRAAGERVWNATRAALAGTPRILLKKEILLCAATLPPRLWPGFVRADCGMP